MKTLLNHFKTEIGSFSSEDDHGNQFEDPITWGDIYIIILSLSLIINLAIF